MRKYVGLALLVLAPVICIAGIVSMLVGTAAINRYMNDMAQQGLNNQSEAVGLVVGSLLGQMAALLLAAGGILVGWIIGLVGYWLYPPATLDSPAGRKVVDGLAVAGGVLMTAFMALLLIGATLIVLRQQPGGVQLSGLGYFLSLVVTLLLAALGVVDVRNGLRNLQGGRARVQTVAGEVRYGSNDG